jgi:drug/metabolite transporter (DMT)-like permease
MLGTFVMPQANDWILLFYWDFFYLCTNLYDKSILFAKAGIIGTISYSNILFSIILGLILGDNFPSISIVFGILLIILSGLLVSSKKE